jgi:hypothetical protein
VKQAVPSYSERSIGGFAFPASPDEEVYGMQAPTIGESSSRMTVDVIKSAPEQRKSALGKIDHGRSDIGFAGKPGLYRVPVAGHDIQEVSGQERPDVRVDQLVSCSVGRGRVPDRPE